MRHLRTRQKSALLTLSAALIMLILAVPVYLFVVSPTEAATSGLASWNPNVACSADLVTIRDVLGPAYPHQDLNGSRYQVNSTSGGIPLERSLSPPCTITNATGQVLSSFVQINNVSLYGYAIKTTDCSAWYSKQNGGQRYPGNQTYCTDGGQIITIGTTSGYLRIEIDRDWLGKGYCGPNVPSCDNQTLFQEQSNGSISLDVQGFVFWEGPWHWELHPFTAWKLSSSPPPPPPSNSPPSVDFTWTPNSGNNTTVFAFTAQASDDHDSASSIQVRWDWTGDGVWDTGWSTTKTATHPFGTAGKNAAVVQAQDSGGLTGSASHTVTVSAPPPPPPPADFSIGASPSSLTVSISGSGVSTITLTSLNGLAGTGSVSASISSSDLVLVWPTVAVSPSSVTLAADGTATSTLTVSTSLLTTPGTYTVTVTATIGSITHSVNLTVVVKLL